MNKNVYTYHMKTENHPPACPAFKRPFSRIYVYSQKELTISVLMRMAE